MAYPTTPKPVSIQDIPFTWPTIQTGFEAGYRQVRQIVGKPLRAFKLDYDGLTDAELATLYAFWKDRMGNTLTFPFVHPVSAETIQCRFSTNTWEPTRDSAYGKGWHSLTLTLEEAMY